MRLTDVLDTCAVKTVTVAPELSLAEAAQAMHRDDAAVIIVADDRFQRVVTAGDILRVLTLATSPTLSWQGPITAALCEKVATATPTEPMGRAIERMTAAGTDHLPVATPSGTVVVSLCHLLLAENAQLHGEVQHLQTYIDALHDAPND